MAELGPGVDCWPSKFCSSVLGKEVVPPQRWTQQAQTSNRLSLCLLALDLTFTQLAFATPSSREFQAPGGCGPADRFSPLLCPRQVDLYGFGADSKGNWHHYWENNPSAGAFRKTGVHDGDFESNVTATLASINKIRIFKGR